MSTAFMTRCWRRSLRINSCRALAAGLLLGASLFACAPIAAQAKDEALSQREIDDLRDAAFEPTQRLLVFEHILDDRERRMNDLLARRKGHTDFAGEMHDAIEQFGAIADELNDNLDEYSRAHRDVRKALPKLLQATDRWSTTLRSPAEDEAYAVVRRIAVDNVKDTHEIATQLGTELEAYFKAHPEAARNEKRRSTDPHAVTPEGAPR